MLIKLLQKIFLEKIKYRTAKSKISKPAKSRYMCVKTDLIEQHITFPRKSVGWGNPSKSDSQDYKVYKYLSDEEFCKILEFILDTLLIGEENLDKPEKISYSNFDDFLEDIDKEEEGIFANIVFQIIIKRLKFVWTIFMNYCC